MSVAHILVVDDEQAIMRTLRANLVARGYDVVTAATGEEAVEHAEAGSLDLVILDLMLPGLSGLEVLQILRGESAVPILVLSAHGEEHLKVRALDLGADDYLTKPFGMPELLARVRALLRRQPVLPGKTNVLAAGAFTVDLASQSATQAGRILDLTHRELDILAYLLRHAGQVVTHRLLLEEVWGPEYEDETQYVRVFINRLRRKIEDDPVHPRHIVTVPGVGYRLIVEEDTGNAAESP